MRNYGFTFTKVEKADKFAFILNKSGIKYIRPDLMNFTVFDVLPETKKVLDQFA